MDSRVVLNPSASLLNNSVIYNTFPHAESDRQAVLEYLNKCYQESMESTNPTFLDRISELNTLPAEFCIHLFVEISKINGTDNGLTFESGEPGCLKAFFQAFTRSLQFKKRLELAQLLELHRICTNPGNVSIPDFETQSSGNFRSKNISYLGLTPAHISLAGLQYLINIIMHPNERFSTMKLILEVDYNLFATYTEKILQITQAQWGIKYVLEYPLNKNMKFRTYLCDSLKKHNITINIFINAFVALFDSRIHALRTDIDFVDILNKLKKSQQSHRFYSLLLELMLKPHKSKLIIDYFNSLQALRDSYAKKIAALEKKFVSKKTIISQTKDQTDKLAENLFQDIQSNNKNLVIQFINFKYVKTVMTELIDEFNSQLDILDTPEQYTLHLSTYTQLFLLVHPFFDGNNRLFANAILNKNLLKRGLPPAIYYDPFVFYGHSPDEVFECLKLANANYWALIKFNNNTSVCSLINFKLSNYSLMDTDRLKQFVKPLKDFIHVRFVCTSLSKKISEKIISLQAIKKYPEFFACQETANQLKNDLQNMRRQENISALEHYLQTVKIKRTRLDKFYEELLVTIPQLVNGTHGLDFSAKL